MPIRDRNVRINGGDNAAEIHAKRSRKVIGNRVESVAVDIDLMQTGRGQRWNDVGDCDGFERRGRSQQKEKGGKP